MTLNSLLTKWNTVLSTFAHISDPSTCCSSPPFPELAHKNTVRLWYPNLSKVFQLNSSLHRKYSFLVTEKTSFTVMTVTNLCKIPKCVYFCNGTLLPRDLVMSCYCCWAHCCQTAGVQPSPPTIQAGPQHSAQPHPTSFYAQIWSKSLQMQSILSNR